MTTVPHEPSHVTPDRWTAQLLVREMWASLAIVSMWLAVLFDAIYGPDIVATSGTPGASATSTTIPSAVAVALFAFLGTWAVARHGFDRPRAE
jgi:hypothetical protein